jgi:glycosyltransferase involved in cell wall biosynthesis
MYKYKIAMSADNQSPSKVAVVFCTKNSALTIANAISSVKQSSYSPSIIVVDGFSSDNTIEIARKAGASITTEQPERKFPGKGIAMKAGLQEADRLGARIVLFLDSDIKNLTSEWVDALVEPVTERGYDMTRGFYERHPKDAAVTKLVARPMLSVFFPELSSFEQPLSGEVCANIRVWMHLLKMNPPDGWGIDVWFLIEAALSGHKVKEIFLGRKEHTSFDAYREDVGKLSKMSEQVLFTIIQEAVKHNRFEAYQGVST